MGKNDLKIAHLSDTHICKSYSGSSMEGVLTKGTDIGIKLRHLLKKAVREKADCLILSGDIVHEGTIEDYQYVQEIVDEVIGDSMKVFYVCGNHDRKLPLQEGLKLTGQFWGQHSGRDSGQVTGQDSGQLLGQVSEQYSGQVTGQYSEQLSAQKEAICYVDYIKDYRIVVLDSAVEGREGGAISREQEQWLAELLKENYGQGTILTFHHPVVWEIPQFAMQVSENFENIVQNSDVIAILCGHTHSNNVRCWKGKPQYTADAMAFGMEQMEDRIAFVEKGGMSFYELCGKSISSHVEAVDLNPNVLADFDMEQMMKFMEEA